MKTITQIMCELDTTILHLENQGFDCVLLVKAAALLIEFNNKHEVKPIED